MYVPAYSGPDPSLQAELLRISQTFQEMMTRPVQSHLGQVLLPMMQGRLDVPASSSVVIGARTYFGEDALYLASVSSSTSGASNFYTYILKAPGSAGTMVLVAVANNGATYQLSVNGSNELQADNSVASERHIQYSLIQLI